MKIENKGSYGYIDAHKKMQLLRTILLFLLPLALFFIGLYTTKTRSNYFTIIAVVGCLPGCKSLVNVIAFLKRHSLPQDLYQEFASHIGTMEVAYELILTTYEITCPVHCAVISGNEIAAYSTHPKADFKKISAHIETTMKNNGLNGVHVHLFSDLSQFLTRVDALAKKTPEEIPFTPDERYPGLNREQVIRRVLLALSM